ncbi:tetratricopeptide repeat protein [Paracoccus sediminicola]|uniref:tetratricopeptide repeat protein n=1 Tax=Paracoccus sediminicola TaxID=3017783 RepID=UPI0022F0CBED|nr:hypothetical protein [Paracoccus sediminicola]WBU57199.1 hypothetical protein PAF18_01760 [Paracoccus sediminicola]
MSYPVFSFVRPRHAPLLAVLTALAGCADPNFGQDPSALTTSTQRLAELRGDLQRDPNDSAALRNIGDMQAESGNWSEAMGAYREALLVDSTDRQARLGFGEGQLALGDYSGALETVRQAGGTDIRSTLLRAGALAGLNRLSEARQVLDAASATAPRNLDVRTNIAIVGGLSGDPEAYAIARAAAFAPDSTYSHRRNLVLVGGMTGYDAFARQDGAQLGLGSDEINEILTLGRRARTKGMDAFGVLAS